MNAKYIIGKSLPAPLCKWWKKSRPCRRGTQINSDMPPCIEFYVPWWAWPFELIHRAIFGNPKLTAIEAVADGTTHSYNLS